MKNNVRRIFAEKKKGFDVEARSLYHDLKENLGIKGITSVRIINRYDIEGIQEDDYNKARTTIFSEPPVDIVYDEEVEFAPSSKIIAVEYLPGQYDQRADSTSQCIQMLSKGEKPESRTAKLIVLDGDVSPQEYNKVKEYCINPVESREASLEKPETLQDVIKMPEDVKTVDGFTLIRDSELKTMLRDMGLAMSYEDIKFCQDYFKKTEKRDPTITEIRLIDTYWSDHCRHTTFLSKIENIEFEDGENEYTQVIKKAFNKYMDSRKFVYENREKDISLMDIATIKMKEMRKKGLLDDLEVSDEINACSIEVQADVNGKKEEWLVMFKNETHNHPTEIEPFGGAATCLGGAIRDPLSGRSYVYQAMRITGSADPRTRVEDTMPGKLPQRKITTGAAAGYSSYGNQIGLSTGQVVEIYDEGFIAKRMEIGAVIGAVPKKNIKREKPEEGDVIILLGGRTGRDGCGGATGSSKEHDEESLANCGAEVQKGNPPTERKIQRLFRNPEVSKLIKKCNDFGAGGVSVAIGELAEGLLINLDAVPKKYEGLDGTELAISESQERMAVLMSKENAKIFIEVSEEENLEATIVAVVTDDNRLKMKWRGKTIVDISRDFLNTNGVKQQADVFVSSPHKQNFCFNYMEKIAGNNENLKELWINNLKKLNVCSQRGLGEMFDGTIGAGSVLLPFGGKYQATPEEGMAAKLPVLQGDTKTATLMAYGYNPQISKWSPFHGALYAVIESVSKIVAMGGDYRKIRLTLQEYFEKLGKDSIKWGKPFCALLGAYYAQSKFKIPAIGGKDSMSGTFMDMDVPPTLVSFAVTATDSNNVVSSAFKNAGNIVVCLKVKKDADGVPDFDKLIKTYERVHELSKEKRILSAGTIKTGGLAEAITKMCFGNMMGFEFSSEHKNEELFAPDYGSLVLEIDKKEDIDDLFQGISYKKVGYTKNQTFIKINGIVIELKKAFEAWKQPLEDIFPSKTKPEGKNPEDYILKTNTKAKANISIAKPRIFMPVFPGTNCEYDTAKAFENAGGIVKTLVIKNLSPRHIEESLDKMVKLIENSQIIMLPGGFSAGDEPEGSGKFIASVFRNEFVSEAVMELLNKRDGLILGICNGFQALIKLGLVPYGEIREITNDCPTLTFNTIGRHVSMMVATKICSNLSPWFSNVSVGDVHVIPVSHGEGRFVAESGHIDTMKENGQIATRYVDLEGKPTYDIRHNPNGSQEAIEGITSPDGRVLGKMGHSERIGTNVIKNVPGVKDQKIFEAGVSYYK